MTLTTLSSFRTAPVKRHLKRVRRIYSYIYELKHATIRVRIEEPEFSKLSDEPYEWDNSVYGNMTKELPNTAPVSIGKYVTTTHYIDTNLFHEILSTISVTRSLCLINKTPID